MQMYSHQWNCLNLRQTDCISVFVFYYDTMVKAVVKKYEKVIASTSVLM